MSLDISLYKDDVEANTLTDENDETKLIGGNLLLQVEVAEMSQEEYSEISEADWL